MSTVLHWTVAVRRWNQYTVCLEHLEGGLGSLPCTMVSSISPWLVALETMPVPFTVG